MALAKKCDVCGKLYEHYGADLGHQYNTLFLDYRTVDGRATLIEGRKHDLCPDCMDEIELAINSLRKEVSEDEDEED